MCSTRIRNCFNSLIARINLRALNNYETPAFDARKIIDASKPFHHCLRAYLYTTTYGHATTSVIKTMHGYSSVPLRTTPLCTALKTRNENRLLGETLKINKETRETRLIAGKYSTAKIASRIWWFYFDGNWYGRMAFQRWKSSSKACYAYYDRTSVTLSRK